jgi:hypothetical protein
MKSTNVLTKITLAAALALALGALAFATGHGGDQGNGGQNGSGHPGPLNDRFAQQIVGSYLGDFPDGARMLLNLGEGGVTHRETSDDFIGLSDLPDLPFARYGGGFGNWTRTGPRTIRIVELAFQFGANGGLSAISKGTVDIEFKANGASATGTAVVTIYLPTQDPLTEEPVDSITFGGIVFRRIQ